MKISAAFPSKYLRAADLPEGQRVNVRIDRVELEHVAGDMSDEEPKPVLYFVGKQKGMVLNKTNANTLSVVYGDDTDTWANQPVAIYATETGFQGKMVPCIRVAIPKVSVVPPGALQAKVAARPAPEPPFSEEPQFKPDDIPF